MPPALPGRGGLLVLIAGFSGVILLLAVFGFHSLDTLDTIRRNNADSDRLLLNKNRDLERIRSSFYMYGAEFRHFLLDSDPQAAQTRLASLREMRAEIARNLSLYGKDLPKDEGPAFDDLRRNVAAYLDFTDPAYNWSEGERRLRAPAFLARDPAEQRVRILQITDKISSLNERRFREGSERSARMIESFRRGILFLLAGALGIGTLMSVAVVRYTFRLEESLRGGYGEMRSAQQRLRELSAKLVKAQEEERRSIARELHDEVGQSLSALLVDAANAVALAPEASPELRYRLQGIRKAAENIVSSARNMALVLRPSMLDDLGLLPALHWQAREISRRTGMRVEISAADIADDLSDEHRTCVYRIVQEALHNSARHAHATLVRVEVNQTAAHLDLVIQDNGKGFDPRFTRGLGLLGMEERVRQLGGTFAVESEPGRGAAVKVRLPLAALSAS